MTTKISIIRDAIPGAVLTLGGALFSLAFFSWQFAAVYLIGAVLGSLRYSGGR